MKTTSYQEFLSLINSVNKNLEKTVYVPSIGDEIPVRPLTANHTKSLIKTTVEGPFSEVVFNLAVYTILRDVLDIDLDKLTIFDKAVILIQLREQNVSNTIKIDEDVISLTEHINGLKKIDTNPLFKDSVVEVEELKGIITYPSIQEEYSFENYFYKTFVENKDMSSPDKLKGIVGPMFMNNVAMYLKTLVIGENEINLHLLPVTERLSILEKLPSSFITQLISKIDTTLGKELSELTTLKVSTKDESTQHQIKIDASFFLS